MIDPAVSAAPCEAVVVDLSSDRVHADDITEPVREDDNLVPFPVPCTECNLEHDASVADGLTLPSRIEFHLDQARTLL